MLETKNINPKKVIVATTKTTLNKIAQDAEPLTGALMADVEKLGITPAGPLEFIYFDVTGEMDKEFTLEIALPVSPDASDEGSSFKIKETNSFKCVTHIHKGSMENMHAVYDVIFKEIEKKELKPTIEVREVYLNWVDAKSADNVTEIQIGIN